MKIKKIIVIIATSLQRTDLLVNRSLKSVYNQQNISKSNCGIIVVDDNKKRDEFTRIKEQIKNLRALLKIGLKDFQTITIKNKRTRFMSGTGAWNTGIFEAYESNPDCYVSILDDDDEYLPNHLADCISQTDKDTVAVFQRLFWQNEDNTQLQLPFVLSDLTPENFFIGNPGIQGSNLFVKIRLLIDINGFDECLPNTTDRDLMIRFLWHYETLKITENAKIKILENIGVKHYNHKMAKVNNNLPLKQQGLDLFYQKYKKYFSEQAYQKSLIRARNFFNYIPIENR